MKINFKLFLLFCFSTNLMLAQDTQISFSGKLVEANTNQPISYATVALYDSKSLEIITGTTTNDDGTFIINYSSYNVYLEISFMGFKTKKINEFDTSTNNIDLGVIQLTPDNQVLDEVVVAGEASKTVFKLDKRIFNVGKDISSTGVSALEVLNNVPSVNVSI